MDKQKALLQALADGLTGYMTYESRCGMSQAYTEYLLYSPIVRIANHLGWHTESEWPFAKTNQPKRSRGDYERIDFLFRHKNKEGNFWVAIEVKWAKSSGQPIDAKADVKKLRAAAGRFKEKDLRLFLLVVGEHAFGKGNIAELKANIKGLPENSSRILSTAYKAHTRYRYGATVYEIE